MKPLDRDALEQLDRAALVDLVLQQQARIAAAHKRSRRTYGAPRVHAELRASGVRCARKRVARLMRAAALAGCHRRRRARTTVTDPTQAPAPNLVARDFTAAAPNRLWIGDITYVPTWEGWLYLAVLWMSTPAAWSAGPWPTTCAPNSPPRHSRWPSSAVGPRQDWSTIPIAGASTPPRRTGRSSP